METCSLDVLQQLTKEDFHLSVCCSACSARNEGEGLQSCNTDLQHPRMTKMHLKTGKRFSAKSILISHENSSWLHVTMRATLENHWCKENTFKRYQISQKIFLNYSALEVHFLLESLCIWNFWWFIMGAYKDLCPSFSFAKLYFISTSNTGVSSGGKSCVGMTFI